MSGFQFLLDENVDPSPRTAARRRLPELAIWAIGDPGAPSRGALDPDILDWCEQHQFILVTNNRASMPVHVADCLAAGKRFPGIFVLHPRMAIGEAIDELELICTATEPDEYRDALHYFPLSQ